MKKILTLMFTVLIGVLFITPLSAASYDTYGDKMDVSMQVFENGQVKVTTVLDVTFDSYRHGLDVLLPIRYDMTFNDKEKVYYFPITDISVKDHNYNVTENRDGVSIRIGSESEQLIGPVRYEYSYTVNMHDLDLDGLQMFYYNIVGNQWNFPIGSTTFRIEMPKDFGREINFYPPSGGSEVDFTRSGNVITGSYNGVLNREAITVQIPLVNDYFTFPNTDFRLYALGFGVVVSAIISVVFLKFGRDPIITESVEFKAPDDLSSAEIGYVYRGMVMQKDVISLIIYWASQGYLIIEELEGDTIRLEKIKNLESSRPGEERRVFNALFKNRDEVTTKELTNTFAATVNHAMSGISKRFTSNPELRVFNRKASLLKVMSSIFAPLIPAFFFAANAYAATSNRTDLSLFFFIGLGVFVIITIAGSFVLAYDRIHKKSQRYGFGFLFILAVAIASLVLSTIPPMRGVDLYTLIMVVVYLVAVFAAANTGKRTEQGTRWLGQILGLQNFIEVAEHDRLVALAEETPEIFYDILPYAYVLGVTDVWSKKFETIATPQPDWYMSSSPNFSTYLLWSSLNRSMRTVSSSMVSVPTPKGSSGGGGSFGGGGGGGFSGGGFGGGGGGSW